MTFTHYTSTFWVHFTDGCHKEKRINVFAKLLRFYSFEHVVTELRPLIEAKRAYFALSVR